MGVHVISSIFETFRCFTQWKPCIDEVAANQSISFWGQRSQILPSNWEGGEKLKTPFQATVDGRKHQLIWQISHYLQGFIHPRWCRISSINRITHPSNPHLPVATERRLKCHLATFHQPANLNETVQEIHPLNKNGPILFLFLFSE